MKWIDIRDRTPDDMEYCLVRGSDRHGSNKEIALCIYYNKHRRGPGFYSMNPGKNIRGASEATNKTEDQVSIIQTIQFWIPLFEVIKHIAYEEHSCKCERCHKDIIKEK